MPALSIPSLKITKQTVQRAANGTTTQDTEQSALRLVVSPKGKRVWQFYKFNPTTKRPVMKKIADAGEDGMAVEVARREVIKLLAAMDAPEAKAKAAAGKVLTLGAIVDRKDGAWLTEHFERHFSDWRELRLDQITPEMVHDREEVILRRAKEQALRRNPDQKDPGRATVGLAAKALRQIYGYAIERGLYVGKDMGQLLPLFKGGVRKVWLKDDDKLLKLMEVLDDPRNGLPTWARPYYLLQVLTGSRGGILAKCRWEWVDWAGKRINLPADETKNGKENTLRLDDPTAFKLLADWHKATKERGSPFIFPSVRDANKPMTNMHGNAWVKVRDLAGLGGYTPHDLRRTFGGRLRRAGVAIEDLSDLMNHSNIEITKQVYALPDEQVLKRAVAAAPLPSRT